MDERVDDGMAPAALGRREVLQRGAFVAGAAALWATPVVQTLGARPAAAGTPRLADFCPELSDSPVPTRLIFEYQPVSCPPGPYVTEDTALEECRGVPPSGPVDIRVRRAQGGGADFVYFCNVMPGARLDLQDQRDFARDGLNPRMRFTIVPTGTAFPPENSDGAAAEPYVQIHTSCSSPLFINQVYASFILRYGEDAGEGFAGDFADGLAPSQSQCGPAPASVLEDDDSLEANSVEEEPATEGATKATTEETPPAGSDAENNTTKDGQNTTTDDGSSNSPEAGPAEKVPGEKIASSEAGGSDTGTEGQ